MTPLRFRDLTPFGRAIIVLVAALTAGVAAVAFMTSYGALYAWVRDSHLYSDDLDHLWPLLLDAAFVAAELAAILGGILRGPRGWPVTVMVITAGLTVFFNVAHAGTTWGDWPKWLAAALPPILMMACFQIDLAIVGWVMRALGRDPTSTVPLGAFYGSGPYGFPPHPVYSQMPSVTQQETSRFGQPEVGEHTKRAAVEMYLSRLGSEQLGITTGSSITLALAGQGMPVDETYAGRILGEWRATHTPHPNGSRRKRPVGER